MGCGASASVPPKVHTVEGHKEEHAQRGSSGTNLKKASSSGVDVEGDDVFEDDEMGEDEDEDEEDELLRLALQRKQEEEEKKKKKKDVTEDIKKALHMPDGFEKQMKVHAKSRDMAANLHDLQKMLMSNNPKNAAGSSSKLTEDSQGAKLVRAPSTVRPPRTRSLANIRPPAPRTSSGVPVASPSGRKTSATAEMLANAENAVAVVPNATGDIISNMSSASSAELGQENAVDRGPTTLEKEPPEDPSAPKI